MCVAFVVVGLMMFMAKSEARIDLKSLMGMWLLNENKGDVVRDSSGNGHDGNFVNDVKWTEGKFGKAVVFNGESHLDHGTPPTLNVGLGNFSLVAWIKTSGDPPDWHAAIIHKAVWPAPRHGYLLCVRGKLDPGRIGLPLLWVGLGTSDGVHLFGTQPINDGKWHHLCGTVDRKTSMKLYVDGEFNAEGNITQYVKENEDNTSKFYIGGEQGRSHVIERTIDEVAVFNTVLTDEDVKGIYQKGLEYALGITAVSPEGKLALTWGGLKCRWEK
jgi:hyaluronate lyase